MFFTGQGAMGGPSATATPNDSYMGDYNTLSRNAGLTKRTVTPQGFQDVYGGLSGADEKQIALAPWNYRQGVFNKTFPLLQGLTGDLGGGNAKFDTVGGTPTALPGLPASTVWSDQQVQQQVNNARAQGDAKAANQSRDIQQEMAGRGFGAKSPLAMAMTQGALGQAAAGNADQEREIRWNAAKGNADQGLQVGQLAQKQWSDFNTNDVQRRQAKIDALLGNQRNMATLISAISGFGG
jgi:hypothetical protein